VRLASRLLPVAILFAVIISVNSCPGALQGVRLREARKARYEQRHNDPIPQAMHLAAYRKQCAKRSQDLGLKLRAASHSRGAENRAAATTA
jgi:hypothetical protein